LTQLQEQKQEIKAKQYLILAILLILCLFISFVLLIVQGGIESGRYADEYFKWWWTWDAYWQFVYFACVFSVALIWRPSGNNKAYAYSMQLPTDESGAASYPSYPNDADLEAGQGDRRSSSSSEEDKKGEHSEDIPLDKLSHEKSSSSSDAASGSGLEESSM